jgi:hypothetical protein
LQIGSFLLIGVVFGASKIFDFLGTITALAAIALYIPANIALIVFVRREHRADFNTWQHGYCANRGKCVLAAGNRCHGAAHSGLSFEPDTFHLFGHDAHRVCRNEGRRDAAT